MVDSPGSRLLDGLLPHYCALCGLRSQRPVPLCIECEREMPGNDSCCPRCAIPLPAAPGGDTPRECGACLRSPPPFQRVIAPWLYGEYLAYLIHRWKYRRDRNLTALLAHLWLQRAEPRPPVDLLVPVPLHWRRRWQRGFNQADLLARRLLADSPAPGSSRLATALVRRTRPTAAQAGMDAGGRSRNLRGAFTVCEPCDNLRIAIVDDVLTTGATAAAVAGALSGAGAGHIEVWCLARTPAPGP